MTNWEYYSNRYRILSLSPELVADNLIIEMPLPFGGSVFQTPNGRIFKTYANAYDYMLEYWLQAPHKENKNGTSTDSTGKS